MNGTCSTSLDDDDDDDVEGIWLSITVRAGDCLRAAGIISSSRDFALLFTLVQTERVSELLSVGGFICSQNTPFTF